MELKKLYNIAIGIAATVSVVFALVFCINLSNKGIFSMDYPVVIDGVSIEKQPGKICSLSPGMTENIYSVLNTYDVFLAVSDYCKIDAAPLPEGKNQNTEISRVGSSQNPHIKQILKLNPDIIITYGNFTQTALKQLQSLDTTIIELTAAKNVEDFLLQYKTICRIFLGNKKGKEFYDEYTAIFESSMNGLLEKVATFSPQEDEYESDMGDNTNYSKSFSQENLSQTHLNSHQTYVALPSLSGEVVTGDGLLSSMLEYSNLKNVAQDASDFIFPMEEIQKVNPYFLICSDKITMEMLTESQYSSLEAIKNNRVVFVDYEAIEQQKSTIYKIYDSIKILFE